MPVKIIETVFISQKYFSVFFYNANQLNNEIERSRKE